MKDRLTAFQHLNRTLETLRSLSQRMPRASGSLADQQDALSSESNAQHALLVVKLSQLDTLNKLQTAEVEVQGSGTAHTLSTYHQALAANKKAAARELDGVQNEMTNYSSMLGESLMEQRQVLETWEETETEADSSRSAGFSAYHQQLQQGSDTASAILSEFDASAACLQAGVEVQEKRASRAQEMAARQLNQYALPAHAQGQESLALSLLEQATTAHGDDPLLWANLSNACLEAGRLEQANQALVRVIQLAPNSLETHYLQARFAFANQDWPRANEYIQICLQGSLAPDFELAVRRLQAETCRCAGDPLGALTSYRRVLELDPFQPEARAWVRLVEE